MPHYLATNTPNNCTYLRRIRRDFEDAVKCHCMMFWLNSPWCKQRIPCKEGNVAGQAISGSTWHGCGDSTSAKPILIYPTRENEIGKQNEPPKAVSPLPRRTRTQQLAQDQAQVERAYMN